MIRQLLALHSLIVRKTADELDELIAVVPDEHKHLAIAFQKRIRDLIDDFDDAVDRKDKERIHELLPEFKGLEQELKDLQHQLRQQTEGATA